MRYDVNDSETRVRMYTTRTLQDERIPQGLSQGSLRRSPKFGVWGDGSGRGGRRLDPGAEARDGVDRASELDGLPLRRGLHTAVREPTADTMSTK